MTGGADGRTRVPLALPDPPLADRGAGIVMRPWRLQPGDVAALVAAWNDPDLAGVTRPPADRSAAGAEHWIRAEPGRRAAGLALDLVVAPLGGAGSAARPAPGALRPGADSAGGPVPGAPGSGVEPVAGPLPGAPVGGAVPLAGAGPVGGTGPVADAVLGEVGLGSVEHERRRAEVGWWLAPAHRGRGLAAAAARLLVGWALADPPAGAGLVQVWARIPLDNTDSHRVARAAGLVALGEAAGSRIWSRARRPA